MQIRREEGGLTAADAGADLNDGVAVFIRVGRQERKLDVAIQPGQIGVQRGDFLGGHGGQFGVRLVADEFDAFGSLGGGAFPGVPMVEQELELGVLAHGCAGAGGIVEQRRVGDGVIQLAEALPLPGDDRAEVHGGYKAKR